MYCMDMICAVILKMIAVIFFILDEIILHESE